MTDKTVTDPMHKAKGIPQKPQHKTSNPITSPPPKKGRGPSDRQVKQNQLRELMENSAEDIIKLMTGAILSGHLDDEKISNSMRLDLMKSFLPYVLPQLKSVEYVESRPADLQPLIINMNGGKASINMSQKPGKESTAIELDSEDNTNDAAIEGKVTAIRNES